MSVWLWRQANTRTPKTSPRWSARGGATVPACRSRDGREAPLDVLSGRPDARGGAPGDLPARARRARVLPARGRSARRAAPPRVRGAAALRRGRAEASLAGRGLSPLPDRGAGEGRRRAGDLGPGPLLTP